MPGFFAPPEELAAAAPAPYIVNGSQGFFAPPPAPAPAPTAFQTYHPAGMPTQSLIQTLQNSSGLWGGWDPTSRTAIPSAVLDFWKKYGDLPALKDRTGDSWSVIPITEQGGQANDPTEAAGGFILSRQDNQEPWKQSANWEYSSDGNFRRMNTISKDWLNNWTGPLAVLGSGLGFAALGGAAGATAAGGEAAGYGSTAVPASYGAGAETAGSTVGAAGGTGSTLGEGANIGAANAVSDASYTGANWGAMGGAGQGAVDTSVMGAGGSGLTAGSAGTGLTTGSSGTGLSLGSSGAGLTGQTGAGLSLSNGATGLGITDAAGQIGSGLGAGLAGGSGTLLTPGVLAGTTTLSTGLVLPSLSSAGAAASALGSSSSGSPASTSTGTPPPANPNVTSPLTSSLSNILNGNGSTSDWLSVLGAGAGALAGSQGVNQSGSSTRSMDPRMDSLFYGGLAPQTQGLLGTQLPQAVTAGNQLVSVGSGLLGQTAPTTATNPYLSSVANDMQRRTQQLLDQNNLAIQGNAVAAGGLGGSRQGVAQGVAAGQAADSLQGQIAGLYGNAYQQDMNRLLQQQTLGAGLISQGIDTPYQPLKNTAAIYSPFTGFGSTDITAHQGGGAIGALGGALGAAQFGRSAGWW